MKRPLLYLTLAALLALCTVLGAVAPASAAPAPDAPVGAQAAVSNQDSGTATGSDTTPQATPTSSDTTPQATPTSGNAKAQATPTSSKATPQATPTTSGGGEKWIEVILSQKLLLAHEGDKIFLQTTVSIGKPRTPTVRGTFRIYTKLRATRMAGPGYNLPNVPNTMYFYRGYAIHGAYWVKTFGTMVSHGCVNVNLTDAKTLFDWAPVGTRVVIR